MDRAIKGNAAEAKLVVGAQRTGEEARGATTTRKKLRS